jgi:hypothetical protein
MRQQLISWLIEDIAPEIRRSKDPEGEILKFAREHNLATAQVQAMGQLFNTAKTLSFFDKSASHRGDPFPILDVDKLVGAFTSIEKKASMPVPRFEFDDQDNGQGISLPACFSGLTHNAFRVEEPAPAQIFDNPVKRASMERSETGITIELTKQAYFEAQEDMRKFACNIVAELRRNPVYTFEELEADALGIYGDDAKPIMDKLAKFCQDDGWPIKRAAAPSQDKLVMDPGGLIPMVEGIFDRTYLIKAAIEILQPSSEAAGSGPILTAAKIPDKENGKVILKDAAAADVGKINPPKIDEQRKAREQQESQPSPKSESPGVTEGPGRAESPSDEQPDSPMKPVNQSDTGLPGGGSGGRIGGGKGLGESGKLFNSLSSKLDSLLGPTARAIPGAGLKLMLPGRNTGQEQVDSDMQDAKHLATLQNLLTTDEILAEADPDKVVNIYNTIRRMAPQLAGDTNVMRVLLRTAVQHEGISPFDLNSILETELSKQKVDEGQRRVSDSRYSIKSPFEKSLASKAPAEK